ncbi:fimbrial biogenesis protein [Burkholderiales bacterium GJ-E10]|nr:fimbrial biogenesis protein [Burkholderiales bacterium GJ-E10]
MTVANLRGIPSKIRSLLACGIALSVVLGSAQAQVSGGAAAEAAAGNSVQSVSATRTGAGVFLTIRMQKPVTAVPRNFSVMRPARIALDLMGATNGLGHNAVTIDQGNLRSVDVVQAEGRTRIVLNLVRSVAYTVSANGNTVLVALGNVNETAPTFPAAPVAASGTPAATPSGATAAVAKEARTIRALDFRRGANGEGRVVVDLSDPNTAVDIRQKGKNVVVDFDGTAIPDSLRRRLDVTDFGTPVARVTASQSGGNAQLVIEGRGLWEQDAYQSDNQFVVELKPVHPNPTQLFPGQGKGYHGQRLSLNFQNVDVRSLLQVIADFTNLNIITSDSVHGTITLRLKDVPWDQALDIILQSKGLGMRKNGNVILIAPREELALKEKQTLEAQSQIEALEPVRAESFVLNYARALDVQNLLMGRSGGASGGGMGGKGLLSKRGSVVLDTRTNQLFVQDIPERLDEIRRLIARIDVPTRQVMIEARIVEAQDTFSQDIGSRLGIVHSGPTSWVNGGAGSTYTTGTGAAAAGGLNTMTVGTTTITNPNFVNLPAASQNGFNPGVIGLTLFDRSISNLLNLELSALEVDGQANDIASPRVVTANNVKATIMQGTQIPYQTVSAGGGIGMVQFQNAVLSLEVTPQITPDGDVFLTVKVHKDTPNPAVSSAAGVAIDTKSVDTQVLVQNGGTVVIGGIFEKTQTITTTKIPFLGDLPYVGIFFRDRAKTNNRTELLIFITPRVISQQMDQAAAQM